MAKVKAAKQTAAAAAAGAGRPAGTAKVDLNERPAASLNGGDPSLKDQPEEIQIRLFSLYFFVACYYNLLQQRADEQWTADDPNMVNLAVVLALLVFVGARKMASDACFGAVALGLSALIFKLGVARQLAHAEGYHEDPRWKYGGLVHLGGAGAAAWSSWQAYSSAKYTVQKTLLNASVVAALAVVLPGLMLAAAGPPAATCRDHIAVAPIAVPILPKLHEFHSRYLDMADGARLAADVHLPAKDWAAGNESYATIIQPTRYSRNVRVRWPFNKFRLFTDKDRKRTAPAAHAAALTAELVKAGYAVVIVDIRGTGASSGARPVDSHPLELNDYKSVVSWVKAQKWSDGIVGASGTGYDGRAAAQMAARGGVGAVAMTFATLDPFADEVAPGGIPCTGFLASASALAAAADRGLPLGSAVGAAAVLDWATLRLDWALGTVTAVEGWENDLEAVTAAHTDNYDAAGVAATTPDLCKDDVIFKGKSKTLSYVELEDRDRIVKGLKKHGVSVYNVGGFFAGRTASEQARLHAELGDNSRLTIGPWSAGGGSCYSPQTGSSTSQYPLAADIRAHFDCALKNVCDASRQADPVSYFTTAAAGWRSAAAWPPVGLEWRRMHFAADGALAAKPAAGKVAHIPGARDSTGAASRWNFARSVLSLPVSYAPEAEGRTNFTSAPLAADLTVVGSAIVQLRLEVVGADDAAVFVYLEEIDSAGNARYVTEGQLRAAHPITQRAADPAVGDPHPFARSYARADLRKLAGETELEIVLESAAHTFAAGSQVRVSVSSADAANFRSDGFGPSATVWSINVAGSFIALPVE